MCSDDIQGQNQGTCMSLCNCYRFLDPLFFGEYPPSMQKLVGKRLPKITHKMSTSLVGSLDFLGINHYTTMYTRNDRTRIRKLVLQDAWTDAAVITTCKIIKALNYVYFSASAAYCN